jgi:hypothetical protein
MTMRLAAGGYECIYNNMPPADLGAVATLVPTAGARRPPRVAQDDGAVEKSQLLRASVAPILLR